MVESRTPNLQSTNRRKEITPVEEHEGSFTSNVSSVNQGRLPKITLPRFNGDIKRYQSFWQSFKCAVDEKESLSDIHKLNYLLTSLEGQAFKALADNKCPNERVIKLTELS